MNRFIPSLWPLLLIKLAASVFTAGAQDQNQWVDHPTGTDGSSLIDHPFIEDRGRITAVRGKPFRLALTDLPFDIKKFGASGLPPGLVISPDTGEITGTPLLSEELEVVISAERNNSPTAFFRFQLNIEAHPLSYNDRDLAMPQGPIIRVQSQPSSTTSPPPSIPISPAYLTLSDALPSGLSWNTALDGITGIAEASGITSLAYTSTSGDPDQDGHLVVSAGDYRSAAPLTGAARQVAMINSIAIGLTNDIRPLVRAQSPDEWSTEPIMALGSNPPWADEAPTDPDHPPTLVRYRDEHFAYLTPRGKLYTSPNGQEWTENINALPEGWTHHAQLHVSDAGALIIGFDDETGRSTVGVTSDWIQWYHVDSLSNGRLTGINAVCHNGSQWIVRTTGGEVMRSYNGTIWHYGGHAPDQPQNLSHLVYHNDVYYAINQGSEPNSSLLFQSNDAVTWDTVDAAPARPFSKLIKIDGTFLALSKEAIYQWNNSLSRLDLIWMAPPGTTLVDADYSTGKVLATTHDDAWLINLSALPPQLQGPLMFPHLDQAMIQAGEPVLQPLYSNQSGSTFVAYQLPTGLSLNPNTGHLTGTLEEPGIYDAVIGVSNSHGEGVPRHFRFFVYGDDVLDEEASATFVQPTEVEPLKTVVLVKSREPSFIELRPTGIPNSYNVFVDELPQGVLYDADSKVLIGRPRSSGSYEAEIHLFSKGASKTITQPIVIIESIEGVTSQYTQTEFATNSPIHIASGGQGQSLTYVAYELPEELQLNPITGDITGSISEVGRYYAHIGKVTAEGVHGHPDIHRIDIRSELIQSFEPLPSLQAGFTTITDAVAFYEVDYPDGVQAEDQLTFLSLPEGITFASPRRLNFDPNLPTGIYRADARVSNSSGFRDVGWWFIRVRPSEGQSRVELQSGEVFSTCLGCSVDLEVSTPVVEGLIEIANLPPGLAFNQETRLISGTPLKMGDYKVGLLVILGDESLAYSEAMIEVKGASVDDRLLAKQAYFTGLRNRDTRWHLPITSDFHSHIESVTSPAGITDSSAFIGGKPSLLGPSTVQLKFSDEVSYTWPTKIYDAPVWENDLFRTRYLPGQNVLQPDQLIVLESFTPFSTRAKFHSTSNGQTWSIYPVPSNATNASLTDLVVTPANFILTGDDWMASGKTLAALNRAEDLPFNETVTGIGYNNGLLVAATIYGNIIFKEDGEDWRSWNLHDSDGLKDLAHGSGRFIAVGDRGRISEMTPDISYSRIPAPVSVDLTGVIYSNGEFYVSGKLGTILSSTNGRDWSTERAPRAGGAEFRYIGANDDLVVAVSPYCIIGKRRNDPAAEWLPLKRMPVEGSVLDDLHWNDGTFAGGYSTGLYVPRRPNASVTVLSAAYQPSILGAPIIYDIAATGEAPVFSVDGLPDGLLFDAANGRIEGQISEAGVYQMLIEASSGEKSHGKTLTVYCWGGVPKVTDPSVEIPIGVDHDIEHRFQVDPPFTTLINEPINNRHFVLNHEVEVFPGGKQYGRILRLQSASGMSRETGLHSAQVFLSNPVGTSIETISLLVASPKPSFPEQPQSVIADLGARVELKAGLQGRLPIELKWLHNGDPVADSDRITGSQSETLVIHSLSQEHTGNYSLQATNELGMTPSNTVTVSLRSGFASWAAMHGMEPTAWLEDHDSDGWNNLLEYALSPSPDADLQSHLPTTNGDAFVYLRAAGRDDVDYVLEQSDDLNEWSPYEFEEAIVIPHENDLEEVRISQSLDQPVGFYRLVIRLTDP